MNYDLAIIGGGPAGVAAGVYASRKRLKTIFITESFGGQSIVSAGIENWIGTVNISGEELAKNLKEHLLHYAAGIVDVKEGQQVESVIKSGDGFEIKASGNQSYSAKTVLVTTGSRRRKLEIPGAETYENKGITYCATCDGPLFSGRDVVVVGGGNAGFESAAQLLAYCNSVTLLNRSENFRADPVTIEKLSKNPKFKIIVNAVPAEVKGEKFASAIIYEDAVTKEKREIQTGGIFVEIGLIPTTEFVANLVSLDQWKHIVTDPKNQRASVTGVWAAGDCTDGLYHQNNIAAGDAVKALEDIYYFLHK